MHKLRGLLLLTLLLLNPQQATATSLSPSQEYHQAVVTEIIEEGIKQIGTSENRYQKIKIRLLDGKEQGKEVVIEHGGMVLMTNEQKLSQNQTIVVSTTQNLQTKQQQYAFVDQYRLPGLYIILAGFSLFVIIMAQRYGVGALIGNAISLVSIFYFIVPQIMQGADPILISIIGSMVILVTTIFLAHGFSQRTVVAVGATIISLFFTGILAVLFVKLAQLSGLGSEDNFALQQGFKNTINFQGLLLGGIIIGTLGVLDDVTTTQTTTIYTLSEANTKYGVKELFLKGMRIGREHIASLVNTLVLAYAGASIGVFIFLQVGLQSQPLWVMLNSELIIEEIVRTLAGSVGLILAVPITTILAAIFCKYSFKIK